MDSNEPLREDTLLADLSRLPWTKGLDEAALQEIADAADFLHVGEGEVIHRAGDTLAAVYFVTRGRIWASVVDRKDGLGATAGAGRMFWFVRGCLRRRFRRKRQRDGANLVAEAEFR